MTCACSQVPGKLIVPRELFPAPRGYIAGFGALGIEAGGAIMPTRAAIPVRPSVSAPTVVVKPPAIVITAAQAAQVAAIAAGKTKLTPAQAVAFLKTVRPPVTFKTTIAPPKISGHSSTSNLSGLTYGAQQRAMAFGGLGRLGAETPLATVVGTGAGAVAGAEAGALYGSVVPGIGTVVGLAVGAIVGLVAGLFGHKKAIPLVSQADIQQAQGWMQQYTQVAGTVVGRSFGQTTIFDLMTAIAILDPAFWGKSTPQQMSIPAVQVFAGTELPTRLQDFFNGMAATPVGATVTLRDNASLPGRAGCTFSPQTYSFANPGVNAPSYVLGPIFAQFMFTMCEVCRSSCGGCVYSPIQYCTGHLQAPLPQLYTDILDYWRSSRPQWDTPQPNVVTGTDLSIAAPPVPGVPPNAAIQPPVPPPVASMQPTGQIAPGVPGVSYAPGGVPVPLSPNATGIYSPGQGGPYATTPASGGVVSNLPGSIPGQSVVTGGGGLDMTALSGSGPMGLSWVTWIMIGAGALLVLRK